VRGREPRTKPATEGFVGPRLVRGMAVSWSDGVEWGTRLAIDRIISLSRRTRTVNLETKF
jgi:hypothetical protein